MTKHLLIIALCATALPVLAADRTKSAAITPRQVIHLVNDAPDCLAQFDTWIVGHGLNNDPERVFRIEKDAEGRPLLRVTGHGYGGLITKRSYRDYRLVVEFRWTGRTSGKREKKARDNGLLLHCTGGSGNCCVSPKAKFTGKFESPWMKGVELQIVEGGVGDILVLGGWKEDGTFWPTTLRARYGKDRDGEPVFDKNAELRPFDGFRLNWWGRDPDWKDEIGFCGKQDVESPMGEWTRVEAIVRGGDFTYFVNGTLVNEANDCSMTEGRILIQTEEAEIVFRKIDLEPLEPARPAEPAKGDTKRLDLGDGVTLEVVYIPPGEFMMGSTAEEKKWATGIEGGAQPGTTRESFEGEQPRLTRVRNGFWIGRTEVSVGQFRRFVEESGYVSDAEKPGGETQVFDPEWDGYHWTTKVVHPWKSVKGKSWRDPNWAFPNRDVFPVVCVSYNDMKAFSRWLTDRERKAGRLPEGLEYRLPTEAEWEYGCRGGSKESLYFWWGNEIEDGEGRLNISSMDFLPGRKRTWPLAKVPWSDGFAFVSPVDHYAEKGRNGFDLADMCGGVWEFVLDHFDPKGGHEEVYYENAEKRTVSRPVCRGGNYFDVPGNARCAVRLGIRNVTYSDSRDGFRICLGVPQK